MSHIEFMKFYKNHFKITGPYLAYPARERHIVLMSAAHVTLQMIAGDEALRTEATPVGLLASVRALVDVEMRGVGEGLGTGFAIKKHTRKKPTQKNQKPT
jgi:hypothetical protein